jgi:SPP1 gp7 family putative phage head morphogenesis protein
VEFLQPIKDKDVYSDPIFKYIARQMFDIMYFKLFQILGKKPEETTLSNAIDRSSLVNALLSGQIWFRENKFYGNFNAAIGKELRKLGANFNSQDKTYFLKESSIPMNIRAIISEAKSKFKQQQDKILAELNKSNIAPAIESKNVKPLLDHMFIDLNKQFSVSMPKNLSVPMDMTPSMKDAIAEDYTHNLNLYIADWYDQEIIKLRGRVEEAVSEGYRADHLRDVLQAEYGVAERKAKFLARQETSLLVSKYRETRYKEANLSRYKWSTSHDIRVRHDHAELNGKIFSWDNPPITDQHTGARNNPGEDFNCRCVAIPIVE